MPDLTRRDFLRYASLAGGALALGGLPSWAHGANLNRGRSAIQHIVVVMMENRSFDHFLGWMPSGRQSGLTYTDNNGASYSTFHLTDYQGCGHPDPDHSYTGGRVEYDNGLCDGWLRAGSNDEFAIGYYTQSDLQFLGNAAPQWTTCTNYYAAIMAETYPNRIYQHAAQTDRLTNTNTISTLPTIWDRLAAANVSGLYYYSDVPMLGLWGSKYVPISRPFEQFLADCTAGTLPSVSFVDPRFGGEEQGTSNDDHPHADIRNGEVFLNTVYHAVTTSPAWPGTVLVINFDEWGGFFEHVPPPLAPIPPATLAAGDTDGRLGFRVPCVVISPFARRSALPSTQFDHTSVLKMIEWRWNLAPLTVRDSVANNLASVLNLSSQNLTAPSYDVSVGPFGSVCGITPVPLARRREWHPVWEVAKRHGWAV